MAEAAQETHEFWRPPVQAPPDIALHANRVQACSRCGTEYIVDSRYCHSCGASRTDLAGRTQPQQPVIGTFFAQFAQYTSRFLSFVFTLRERTGLSTGAFTAFLAGVVCLVGALGVGVIFSARTVLDWQAVQLWRIEWLLGAVAAFAAGCLLKQAR